MTEQGTSQQPHVVIVGGGFGGLYAALSLRRAPVRVTLVDQRNFHVFQPLLFQVATGGLSPANVAAPLRGILRNQANTRVLLAEVTGVDVARRVVQLDDGELQYDSLIVATGSTHNYFGHPEWAPLAPGLKTIEDATEIRSRIFLAFEAAEREPDPARVQSWLTFVVVGAGPTGAELAGAVAEIAHDTLRREFRGIDPARTRVLLVEAGPRALPVYPPKLSDKAAGLLTRLGVELRLDSPVTGIDVDGVTVSHAGQTEVIAARTVLWSAGILASPLAACLAGQVGVPLDRSGRIHVGDDLSLPGHPEVFVVGDMAHLDGPGGRPLPCVAQVAMQGGRHAARLIAERVREPATPTRPFHYRDLGSMSSVGRGAAVADIRGVCFSGYPAWWLWLLIHLMMLVQFGNRVLVLVQWAWNYLTRNRSARLITHPAYPGGRPVTRVLPPATPPREQAPDPPPQLRVVGREDRQ